MFTVSHSKSIEWSYESEYRITRLFYPEVASNSDRILHFPNQMVAEVILGVAMTENHKQEILEICRHKGYKVYQAAKVQRDFNLTLHPL
jgi:hypothetical protein